jgi:ankyrin repeat protein
LGHALQETELLNFIKAVLVSQAFGLDHVLGMAESLLKPTFGYFKPFSSTMEEAKILSIALERIGHFRSHGDWAVKVEKILRQAMSCQNHEAVKALVKMGAYYKVVDQKNSTLLTYACKRNQTDLIEDLLKAGDNPDAQDSNGKTALHHVVSQTADLNIIKVLVGAGNSSNIQDSYKNLPLHEYLFARDKFSPDIIRALLPRKYMISTLNDAGLSPLHYVCKERNPFANKEDFLPVVQILLESGADPALQDSRGKSPLHYLT